MADRKRSKAEEASFARMAEELTAQLAEIDRLKLKLDLIPPGWHEVEKTAPVQPGKTKLTMRLDADMVAWFRALGRGYQPRINAVLRAYMHAVVAKEITRPGERDCKGDAL